MLNKIAVIGGGAAGIITVDTLARCQDQSWEIVGFEGRAALGGVWSDIPGTRLDDPDIFGRLRTIATEIDGDLSAEQIFHQGSPVVDVRGHVKDINQLLPTSYDQPLKLNKTTMLRDGIFFSNKTGLHTDSRSSVPKGFMEFDPIPRRRTTSGDPVLYTWKEVRENINDYVSKNDIYKYYRMNTSIELIDKMSHNEWVVVAKRTDAAKNIEEWYLETFNAIVICSGYFQVPYIPFYMNKFTQHNPGIHNFNVTFPEVLVHTRDIDQWYHNVLPKLEAKDETHKILIVGSGMSCIDVLPKIAAMQKLNIIISKIPGTSESEQPIEWFNEWLSNNDRITLKSSILNFLNIKGHPAVQFTDGSIVDNISHIIFATGYMPSLPFLARNLASAIKVYVTSDKSTLNLACTGASRVTSLYVHTVSISDPTLGFVFNSQTPIFQSFHLSAQMLAGIWSRYNNLLKLPKVTKNPWSQILPSIEAQLEWARRRLKDTGNNSKFHCYNSVSVPKSSWLAECREFFYDPSIANHMLPTGFEMLIERSLKEIEETFRKVSQSGS
ncbi:uncharacterized protein Ecym_5281 [Eremothecium cymbalariae DBVPG|uniref:FAD/NAD(P)-binding domain-containing protein n=1 Tax=Eremothecium cymbalariae (strain CBS 270.75 / DBVPG 7215 / KCTC 17166 / NRRL Y-17582) TaxID=931890 RepID=I6NDA1_ERECY|nr:hypothetical protein Ecym_5281 [Eremothecium cymbalariae DBVPG\